MCRQYYVYMYTVTCLQIHMYIHKYSCIFNVDTIQDVFTSQYDFQKIFSQPPGCVWTWLIDFLRPSSRPSHNWWGRGIDQLLGESSETSQRCWEIYRAMGKPWENHGKTMGKWWDNCGFSQENHRKTRGKYSVFSCFFLMGFTGNL